MMWLLLCLLPVVLCSVCPGYFSVQQVSNRNWTLSPVLECAANDGESTVELREDTTLVACGYLPTVVRCVGQELNASGSGKGVLIEVDLVGPNPKATVVYRFPVAFLASGLQFSANGRLWGWNSDFVLEYTEVGPTKIAALPVLYLTNGNYYLTHFDEFAPVVYFLVQRDESASLLGVSLTDGALKGPTPIDQASNGPAMGLATYPSNTGRHSKILIGSFSGDRTTDAILSLFNLVDGSLTLLKDFGERGYQFAPCGNASFLNWSYLPGSLNQLIWGGIWENSGSPRLFASSLSGSGAAAQPLTMHPLPRLNPAYTRLFCLAPSSSAT